MKKVTNTSSRKADHIRINLEEQVTSSLTTRLEEYRFIHEALPDLDLAGIDLTASIFNSEVQSPLYISSMTGGTEEAARINRNLSLAAQQAGIAMGVGSQRAALEDPSLAPSFQIRQYAPDILLFANLGAVQLNYGIGVDGCRKVIDMIEADALILHLNALQEALQPEGDSNFKGLLNKIEQVAASIDRPVIIKEVGWGISVSTAKRLYDVGVTAFDIAGSGGTSWSQVEMYRAKTDSQARIASQFINWGIPTAEAISQLSAALPDATILASGGLKNGVDIAKSIALGADLGGMASPFLKAAVISQEAVYDFITETNQVIKIAMFAAGIKDLKALKKTHKLVKVT
ncbi:MAG: type 2 isopentenyl-diphosphate Delta-isomerase [Anaerolineales bacterium]|nr:type 2 isopentenyl-diphosphate Delta-isomerase [Anaerolineales bacterium]